MQILQKQSSTTKFSPFRNIYSRFLRLSTARGSGTGLVTVGPAKVKACKSFLFTEGVYSLKVSLKSKSE